MKEKTMLILDKIEDIFLNAFAVIVMLTFILGLFTQFVFVILKIFNVITWRWPYVMLPLIILSSIIAVILLVISIKAVIDYIRGDY